METVTAFSEDGQEKKLSDNLQRNVREIEILKRICYYVIICTLFCAS